MTDYTHMRRTVHKLTYGELQEWLSRPDSRVLDCRILELASDVELTLQFLCADESIRETQATDCTKNLDLWKLHYYNSKRMNPALWGTFDGDTHGN